MIEFIEFIQNCKGYSKTWIHLPQFKSCCVKFIPRLIDNELKDNVITIAYIEAEEKGNGAFSSFAEYFQKEYPHLILYMECVINPRFASKLEQLGFHKIEFFKPQNYNQQLLSKELIHPSYWK